jgi:hypothetical protein
MGFSFHWVKKSGSAPDDMELGRIKGGFPVPAEGGEVLALVFHYGQSLTDST